MNPDPSTTPSSVDDGIHAILSSGKEKAIGCLEQWENNVRRHPAKAVLGAVVAGALIHRLPIRSLIVAKVKIIAALAPPAILAYGAAKLCEILQQKGAEPAGRSPIIDPSHPEL